MPIGTDNLSSWDIPFGKGTGTTNLERNGRRTPCSRVSDANAVLHAERILILSEFERYLLSWEAWYEIHVLNRTADLARIKAWESKPYFPLYTLLEPRLHLSGLCVSLEHQRRGIGMKLLQHGQEIATEESIPVTLKASVIGRLLYQKCGFKIIDQRALEGGPDTVVMCWEPEHLRGKWLEDVGGGKSNVIGRT